MNCPNCGSSATTEVGPMALALCGALFLWVPVLGWIIAPVCFLAALATWISKVAGISKERTYYCRDCKKMTKVDA